MPEQCPDCGAKRYMFRVVRGRLVSALRVRQKPGRVYLASTPHEHDCPRWKDG
jgi:hypothetical protein